MSEEKRYCKTIQLIHGVDLLGSRMSLSAKRGHELEVTPFGVQAQSTNSKRTVLIPWNNIRGVEMFAVASKEFIKHAPLNANPPPHEITEVVAKPRGRPKAQV